MRFRHLITCVILGISATVATPGIHARGWETVKTERSDAKTVARESDIEIRTAPGVIMVASGRPVQIKIFTILGRLVNSDTLPQGTLQFMVPAHGVYIVKAGDITCKVAV